MNAKFHFANLVYVTLKKYSDERSSQIEDRIGDYAKANKLKIMCFDDGWVMAYELAKQFARNLHFHCSRVFSFNEAMDLLGNEMVSMSDVETAQII